MGRSTYKNARTGLGGMLEWLHYLSLDRIFRILATVIDQWAEYEQSAHITGVYMRYCEVVASVTEDTVQQGWS